MGSKDQKELIEDLCADTWKDLYRFIYYKVQNREEAQDITQETYVRAISYLMKNDIKIMKNSSYLKSIAMNVIRDRWRLGKRRSSINLDEADPEDMMSKDFSDSVTDRASIEEAMEKLTRDQQTVITLRIIQGYSVADTARMMKKKEGTVRVLQYRAVKALSDIMSASDY